MAFARGCRARPRDLPWEDGRGDGAGTLGLVAKLERGSIYPRGPMLTHGPLRPTNPNKTLSHSQEDPAEPQEKTKSHRPEGGVGQTRQIPPAQNTPPSWSENGRRGDLVKDYGAAV